MNRKRILVLVLSLMMLIGLVLGATSCDILGSLNSGNTCEHQWNEATCTEPKTCTLCQAVEGDALGHTGGEATCTDKAVCTRCENEYGELAEHEWLDATCDKLAECKNCGATTGELAAHTPEADDGDCSTAVNCTVCGGVVTPAGQHTPAADDGDCTTAINCTVCGAELTPANTAHTPAEDDGDCTTAINCTVCGKEVTAAKDHTPEADDGDCTTAINCTVCGKEVTAAKDHTPETDDGDCTTAINCTVCGKEVTAANEDHTPAEDDGDCTTAINCTVCGKEVTAANEAHTPAEDDGDCTTAVNCTVCGKEVTAANEAHTPAEDDGDCTTAINCTVCGKEVTAANEAHTPAEDDGDCTTAINCTVCGKEITAAKDHTPAEDDSDCDTPTKCTECGTVVVESKAHTGGTATCTDKAVCEVCGKTYGSTLEHSFTEENTDAKYLATPATCEAAATYYYSCANCGDRSEETFVYGEPTGHSYGAWVSNGDGTHTRVCLNDASHVENGNCSGGEATCIDRAVCSECNEEYGDEPSHVWDDGTVTAEPDCVTAGVRTYSCSSCDEKKEETIAATGHSYVDTVTDPTCLTNGYTTHTCQVCSDKYTDTEVDALGHTWNTELTCTEGHFCTAAGCDASEEALGHSYESVGTTAADCENAGTETFVCSACEDSYTNTTEPAKGHNIVGVTAAEEHLGGCDYLQVYTCNDCGERVEGETVVHHTYSASITTPATCKEEGLKTITCSVCSDSYTEAISVDTVIGHSWVEGDVLDGKRTDTCAICGETKSVTVVTNDTVTSVGDLKDTEISLEGGANITLGGNAADNIGTDTQVSVSADTLTEEEKQNLGLTEDALAQVKGEIYNFSITSDDNTSITSFGEGGYVTVTLPYELEDGEDVDNIAVWYINENSELESIKATYNNGYVTFVTNHFSYYTVTRLTPAQRCALYGHVWTDKVVEATCTSDGYTIHRCTRCGRIDKLDEVEAYGHDLNEILTEATCTADGSLEVSCNRCSYHETQKISAIGHVYTCTESTPASCSSVGYELYECDNCDYSVRVTLTQLKHEYTSTNVAPTCGVNGYTLHECQYCDYSYTDTIVPALEHDYDAEWKWDGDHKHADVHLVCKHGCGHYVDGEAQISERDIDASCSKEGRHEFTGKFTHNGKTYTDKFDEKGEKLPHNYKDEWKHDHHGHWHECRDCGEKHEIIDHEFGEGTVIKRPGCATKGEMAYVCSCGFVKIEAIEPTGDHSFAGGVCIDCGFSRNCDHSTFTKASLDLSELGYCEGILYYETCECGAVKRFDMENSTIECESDNQNYGEGVDENGVPYAYMTNHCSNCGLYLYGYATYIEDGCYEAINVTYYFYTEEDGDLIITLSYTEEDYYHETEELPLGIADKSCGTEIYVEKCVHCGTVEDIGDLDAKCSFEYGSEEFYDDAGNPHQKQIMTCPDCGLVIIVEMYVVNDSVCQTTMYGILEVYIDGELYFDFTMSETEINHSYEETYELHGETCEDGYTVRRVCTQCGIESTWHSSGHITSSEHFQLDEYGMCGGYGYKYVCSVCDTVTGTYVNWTGCSWYHEGYDEELGVDVYVCESCGATRHYSYTRSEKDESCNITITIIEKYYIGEYVIDASRTGYYTDHSMKYEYTLNGESCEDGWSLYAYCEDCGYSYGGEGDYHNSRRIYYYDLSALGMCGTDAYLEVYSCACGEDAWANSYFYDGCEWMHEDIEGYVDDNGYKHSVSKMTCSECNTVIIRDSYTVAEGCYRYNYTTYTITIGGETVVDGLHIRTGGFENHKYVYDYTLDGESCEDGWTLYAYCEDCGYEFTDEGTYHNSRRIYYYDLSALGMCGTDAYLEVYSCACGEDAWVNSYFYDGCEWMHEDIEGYVDDNGYKHSVSKMTCKMCGSVIITDSYTVSEGCYRYNYTTYTITIGGETVVDGLHIRTGGFENHKYVYDYTLDGESCEDGWTLYAYCEDCGYEFTDEGTYHNSRRLYYYDLSALGMCGENAYLEVYSCACGEDAWVNSYFYDGCEWSEGETETYEDGNGYTHNVSAMTCSECNTVIIRDSYTVAKGCYRYNYTTYTITIGGETVVDGIGARTGWWEIHDYEYEFTLDGESCEDGVYVNRVCKVCGESYSDYYTHHYDIGYYYGLYEYGACGGYAQIRKCPCGEVADIYFNGCGNGYYTYNDFVDDDGILKHMESYYCDTCQLRYDRKSHYTTENCVRTYYYEVSVSIGAELILNESYTREEEYHDYEATGTLMDGATSCDDGVYATYTCKDCGYSYDETYYHHRQLLVDRIELTQYGSVCPGYLVIRMCACGEDCSVYTDEALCEFDHQGEIIWIENAIDDWQQTAEGDYYFGYSGYKYVCAVTDPEQCGFTVRIARYWLKNSDCTATRYLTVQLGYDELDGTCEAELTYELYSRTYHNYGDTVYTSSEQSESRRTTCVDCGSYYEYGNEYSENYSKDYVIYVNTLDDGNRKYREELNEYTYYYEDGAAEWSCYVRHNYRKYVEADGSESWYDEVRTSEKYDGDAVIPLAVAGYIYKTTYTDSYGRNEYTERLVFTVEATCCGYTWSRDVESYYYSLDNNTGYWWRCDSVYGDTVCYYTEIYTDSDGARSEYEGEWHYDTHYNYVSHPTCTQYGEYSDHCVYCKYTWDSRELEPTDHNWVLLSNGLYYCYECGLQNINGASGDVVMEDLTDKYGNGENYVIGYWSRTHVNFSVYVSLMLYTPLEDGTDQINLADGIDYELYFVEDPYVGLYVSMAQVEAAAQALGYTADMYDVRISFVPDGADGSFDYAITFGDLAGSEDIDYVIERDEYFVKHVLHSDEISYTVCPTESGNWRFAVEGADYYYYGAQLQLTDENGDCYYGDCSLEVYLEAGKTYTITYTWYYGCEDHGYVAFIFDCLNDTEAEGGDTVVDTEHECEWIVLEDGTVQCNICGIKG